MRIERLNEKYSQQKELNDFAVMIVKEFFGDDTGNMFLIPGTEYCILQNKKIQLNLEYMVIEEDELDIILNISKYLKSFDSSINFHIVANLIHKNLNVPRVVFNITLNAYPKIWEDLEIRKDAKRLSL